MTPDLIPLMHDDALVEESNQLCAAHLLAIDEVCPDGERRVDVEGDGYDYGEVR